MSARGETSPRTAGGPWLVDAALAVVVAIVLSTVIALSSAGDPPDAFAFVFAVGFGAVLLLRRQLPVPVLVLSVLGTFAYYTLGFTPIGIALPVVAALYSAAEAGAGQWAVGAGSVVFVVSMYFRLRDDPLPFGYVLGTEAVSTLALIAAAIALGYGIRSNRERAAQQEQIRRLSEAQSAREAELRVQAERERISRELHDTLGHALSVIALHASVGVEAVSNDGATATAAFEQVRRQSTSSLRELRSMVRLLRTAETYDESRRVHSLADIQVLLDEVVAAGVRVSADIDVESASLPAAVDGAAYRVIQEALTNVVRHAQATIARVNVSADGEHLRVTVSDDGLGGAASAPAGYGITGMAERVRLLGGSLRAHGDRGAGFTVEATIPTRLRIVIRIALIDDQELVRTGLRSLAEHDGDIRVVAEAADGRMGLSLIREHRPDVVLMDIRMPRLNGIAATEQISADPDLADVRVIVLTTFDEDENVLSAIRAGAAGYLLKDVAPDDLRTGIRVVAAGDSLLSPAITTKVMGHLGARLGTWVRPELLDGLTDRERDVLARVGQGESNDEIGARLHISPATARTYVGRLLAKLGARDRAQLVVLSYESGLISPGEADEERLTARDRGRALN